MVLMIMAVVLIASYVYSTYVYMRYTVYEDELFRHRRIVLRVNYPFTESDELGTIELSDEYELLMAKIGESFNVMDALKRDGYEPKTLSMLEARRREISPTETEVEQMDRDMEYQVPNVVHYVYIGTDLQFTFINYLSFRSVDRFIQPEQIFIHGDHIPDGEWWNRTIQEVKNIYYVKTTYWRTAPNGQLYRYPAHISDYKRLEILLRFGGIYLDPDVLVVKSFTPLRRYPFVIGRETPDGLCNGIMVAKRGAPFLRLLLEQYRSYSGENEPWSEKSVFVPHILSILFPHLVHVEEKSLNRPNWMEVEDIYDGLYNWSDNYAIHLWVRRWSKEKIPADVWDILQLDTTMGQLARVIVFGSTEIRNETF